MSRDRERTRSRCWLPPPRTCSQLPVPGHEITALSLWKRLLPPLHGHPLLPTYIDLRPACRLARLPLAACLCQTRFALFRLRTAENYVARNFDKTGFGSSRHQIEFAEL